MCALGPVVLQPVHDLHDARLAGAEAQGGHGWTRAARARLTELLLHVACEEAVLWRAQPGTEKLTLSVRLPAGACDAPLADLVAAALSGTGLPAEALELGICSDVSAPPGRQETLAWTALREMGVGLALELGTQQAACPCLTHSGLQIAGVPPTSLRLPSWVAGEVERGVAARALVGQAVRAAGAQHASVSVGCVRTATQRDILADLGCRTGSGPLFGLPMHPAEFQAALADGAPV